MVKIAPSILSADFSKFESQIKNAIRGGADWLHLDVMDGHFVPNITFGPIVVSGVRKLTEKVLDVHLMIENADIYLENFINAGADILTVHYEACTHLWRTIDTIHQLGVKAGVTINPATPVQLLDPVLELADLVLVMSVEPGFGGQSFIPSAVSKIEYLHKRRRELGLAYVIEVDGGIDAVTTPQVVKAGVDILVAGSSIFNTQDVEQAIARLREAARV